MKSYSKDLKKETELFVIKKQNERVKKVRAKMGHFSPLPGLPALMSPLPKHADFGIGSFRSSRKYRGPKKVKRHMKRKPIFDNEMTDERIGEYLKANSDYQKAKKIQEDLAYRKPYKKFTIKPSDFEHIFTLVNDYFGCCVEISEEGIKVLEERYLDKDALTSNGKLYIRTLKNDEKPMTRFQVNKLLEEYVFFSKDPEFNCVFCDLKLKDEPSLRGHLLFQHGKYMECCSTNLMAKTFEKEQEARVEYKKLNEKLRQKEYYIKNHYAQILKNLDAYGSAYEDLIDFLESDVCYEFSVRGDFRENDNFFIKVDYNYDEVTKMNSINKTTMARLLKHCENYNNIRKERNEVRKKIKGIIE